MQITYVAKMPPSRSGVARYSAAFAEALRGVGTVTILPSGHEARETTTLRRIATIVLEVRAAMKREPDLLVLEVSGGAMAELLAAAYAVLPRRSRRPLVWLTVHDPPQVTGGLLWIALLNRKGLRRVARALSATAGTWVERATLSRVDVVVCLSEMGAVALRDNYSLPRKVGTIHGVAAVPAASSAPEGAVRIFLPGPVQPSSVEAVLQALAPVSNAVMVVVGFSTDAEREIIDTRISALDIGDRVRLLPLVSQTELEATYQWADIVVHWRASAVHSGASANWAACSGPTLDAFANGCALVTNAARSAGEYIAESGAAIDLSSRPEDLARVLRDLVEHPEEARALGLRASEYASRTLSPEAVAREVRDHLGALSPALALEAEAVVTLANRTQSDGTNASHG